ncbi:MAG: prepilin-type N-terminal cleavage/methylation domain-containing protein [Elusimicrobiota bacterium]
MKLKRQNAAQRAQAGFTLIELLVVVLIIGILAAIAVPQYFKVVEKGKASEAFATLDALRGAQDRYLATRGVYCAGNPNAAIPACPSWDIPPVNLKYFTNGIMAVNAGPGWNIVLTRRAPLPAVYGGYNITYTVNSGAPPIFTCSVAACTADLLPQ